MLEDIVGIPTLRCVTGILWSFQSAISLNFVVRQANSVRLQSYRAAAFAKASDLRLGVRWLSMLKVPSS